MTESIVRDPQVDGHWTVYVDGFAIGELIADCDADDWPASYHYILGFYVGPPSSTLAEANSALIKAHQSTILGATP